MKMHSDETGSLPIPEGLEDFLRGKSWRSEVKKGDRRWSLKPLAALWERLSPPPANCWEVWRVRRFADAGFFKKLQILEVSIHGHQLEGAWLPSGGSFGFFAATNGTFLYLNRRRENLARVFRSEGRSLISGDSLALARLLVECVGRDGNSSHDVIESAEQVASYRGASEIFAGGYVANDEELTNVVSLVQPPSISEDETGWSVECCSLYGWMHRKTVLMKHRYRLQKTSFAIETESTVLSRKIFRRTPGIRY